MSYSSQQQRHRRLPAERFFWGIIRPADAGLPRRPAAVQLGYLFERVLPLSIEELQTAYRPMDGGRWLACAMKKSDVAAILSGDETSLTPNAPPVFLADEIDEADLVGLNLLTGEFEPAPVKQWKRRCLIAAVCLFLTASAGAAGVLLMQERAVRGEIARVQNARTALIDTALGFDNGSPAPAHQPPELRLVAELRQLRRIRQPDRHVMDQPDVADELARFLSSWPQKDPAGSASDSEPSDDLYIQTELISITPTAINVRALLPTAEDAERFAAALRATPQWELSQPEVASASDAVRASFRLTPETASTGEESS